jgi:MFS family permease
MVAYSQTGAGVIGDVTTQDKRGGVFGFFISGPLASAFFYVHSHRPHWVGHKVGPVLGPVIGGALADKLGWR